MAFSNVINRSDVAGIIPMEMSTELINTVATESSHVMRLARRLRDMSIYETDMPVLSALATAYFPDGDTGLVETSEVNWTDVTLYAKDLAVLVPIPKNVLSDARVPIWSEVQPIMRTAVGAAIDKALLYGTNKPVAWPSAIITGALAAGHNVSLAAFADAYDAFMGPSGLFGLVEADGFGVTGVIAELPLKAVLRGTRATTEEPIFSRDPAIANQYILDGRSR